MKVVVFGATGSTGRLKLALKEVMADKEPQEAAVRQSGCDWTIVRPGNADIQAGSRKPERRDRSALERHLDSHPR